MLQSALNLLREKVFDRQKELAEIYRVSGNLSLADYVNGWQVAPAADADYIFYKTVLDGLSELYGTQLALEAAAQLKGLPLVSTIDHIGLLNHPFFINSNLIYGLRSAQKYLIALPTVGVSLNNSSWPGCLVRTGGSGEILRYSFFADRLKTRTAYGAPAITEAEINKVKINIRRDAELSPAAKEKVLSAVSGCLAPEKMGKHKNFIRQACAASSELWRHFFPSAPELVYLPLEDIVREAVIRLHRAQPDNILSRLFFTLAGWEKIQSVFLDSRGAFSAGYKGSFLFWGLDKNGRRAAFYRQGAKLSGMAAPSGLSPEEVFSALADGRVYPTSLVCFMVLLHFGVTAAGGFNQVNWLTEIKKKYAGLLVGLGEAGEAARVSGIAANSFAEGGLAFLPGNGGLSAAGGLDLLVSGKGDWAAKYRELAKKITVKESIDFRLPETYRVITPFAMQDWRLLDAAGGEIASKNGLSGKIFEFLS